MASGPRSTKSTLRADILKLKEKHLKMNLEKQMKSTSKMMALSQEDNDDSVSASERYDLKAYAFNQYFPQAKNEKSQEQWLEEKREELGLNSIKDRKRYSMQDEDAEPRYEISKLSRMAKKDLDATNDDN